MAAQTLKTERERMLVLAPKSGFEEPLSRASERTRACPPKGHRGLTAAWTAAARPRALSVIYEVSGYSDHKVGIEQFLHFNCHERETI